MAIRANVRNCSGSGWASYSDTQYTQASPFVIASGALVTLPNNAGNTIETYLPPFSSSLYDGAKIRPIQLGDYYILTIRFQSSHDVAVMTGLEFGIDIGGTQGIIFKEELVYPKGSNEPHSFSIPIPFYALNTFISNGGTVKLLNIGTGSVNVWSIQYQIARVYKI